MGKSQNETIALAYEVLEDFGVLTDDCHEQFGSNIKIHNIKELDSAKEIIESSAVFLDHLKKKKNSKRLFF